MIQETVKKQEKAAEVDEELDDEVIEIDLNASPKVERVEETTVFFVFCKIQSNFDKEIISTHFWKEDDPFFSVQSNRWKTVEPEFMLFIASNGFTLGGDTLPCPWVCSSFRNHIHKLGTHERRLS